MTIRTALLALAACSCLVLTACGGGSFSCSDQGSCPNDPASTQSDIDECNAELADVCGADFRDFADCAKSNSHCDSTDGQTTLNDGACEDSEAAYFACCSQNPSACGGT